MPLNNLKDYFRELLQQILKREDAQVSFLFQLSYSLGDVPDFRQGFQGSTDVHERLAWALQLENRLPAMALRPLMVVLSDGSLKALLEGAIGHALLDVTFLYSILNGADVVEGHVVKATVVLVETCVPSHELLIPLLMVVQRVLKDGSGYGQLSPEVEGVRVIVEFFYQFPV